MAPITQLAMHHRIAASVTLKELVSNHYERRETQACMAEEDRNALKSSFFNVFQHIQNERALR